MTDLVTPEKPKFQSEEETKAEYSPWGKIFMRIELVVDRITEFSMRAKMKEITAIEPFYYSLQELYDHIYPLLIDSAIDQLEIKFKLIDAELAEWKKKMNEKGELIYPENIVTDLQYLKRNLLDLKQKVGLGVPVEKVVSIRRKLKRLMGLELNSF